MDHLEADNPRIWSQLEYPEVSLFPQNQHWPYKPEVQIISQKISKKCSNHIKNHTLYPMSSSPTKYSMATSFPTNQQFSDNQTCSNLNPVLFLLHNHQAKIILYSTHHQLASYSLPEQHAEVALQAVHGNHGPMATDQLVVHVHHTEDQPQENNLPTIQP